MLSAVQLRDLLGAIVNLDPYTFADDLAADVAEENERRSPSEVLLAGIAVTADDKLSRFAVRLALNGHLDIPATTRPTSSPEPMPPSLLRGGGGRRRAGRSGCVVQVPTPDEGAEDSEEADCS